jgi:cation:H+ antiporter
MADEHYHEHHSCIHDHEHDHENDHHHQRCGHGHSLHNYKKPREKFSLIKAFRQATCYVSKNRLESSVLLSSLLLGTTALSTPLVSTVTGACALMAGAIYMLKKTGDITVNNMLGFGDRLGMSALTLGLLIGGLNTIPEVSVTLSAVAKDATEIGIGNIVGSNIAHVLLILGATATVAGLGKKQKGLSWPFNTVVMGGATALFGAQLVTGKMSPAIGVLMLATGAYYLKKRLFTGREGEKLEKADHNCRTGKCLFHDHGDANDDHHHDHDHDHDGDEERERPAWLSGALGIGGLAGLIASADILVESGSAIARNGLGIDEAVIGAVAVAIGTSLPELVISIKAALKNHSGLALGNVLGCTIFNTLVAGGVMGLTGVDVPEAFNPSTTSGMLNIGAFLGSSGLLAAVLIANRGGMKRGHGAAALGLYTAYIGASLALNGGSLEHFHRHSIENKPPAIEQTVKVAENHTALPESVIQPEFAQASHPYVDGCYTIFEAPAKNTGQNYEDLTFS